MTLEPILDGAYHHFIIPGVSGTSIPFCDAYLNDRQVIELRRLLDKYVKDGVV